MTCFDFFQQGGKAGTVEIRTRITIVYLVTLHNTMPQIAKEPESPCFAGFSGALRCLFSLKNLPG